jgi:hypothetical protein
MFLYDAAEILKITEPPACPLTCNDLVLSVSPQREVFGLLVPEVETVPSEEKLQSVVEIISDTQVTSVTPDGNFHTAMFS